MTETATPPAPQRRGRRLTVLLAVLALLFAAVYARGTWATADPSEPASPAQGARSRLVLMPDGHREIRTSVVLPVKVATAWAFLSNYDEWEKLFKTVRRNRAEKLEGNKVHVTSSVTTPMGTLDLDFVITHEDLPGGGHRAWWDAPTKELPVNRGEIRVTPTPEGDTLFVYTVHKVYSTYPTFLVNNLLLGQQRDLVATMSRRIVEMANE